MADPINYSGVTYDQSFARLPNETLFEYMQRLAKLRAGGVLGGGGMLDAAPVASVSDIPVEEKSIAYTPKLGQVVINAGSGGGDSNTTVAQRVPISEEQRLANAADVATGRDMNIPAVLGFLGGPIGTAIDKIAEWDRNRTIDKALDSRAYTEEQKDIILNDRDLLNELVYGGNLSTVAPKDTNKYGVDTWNWETQVSDTVSNLFGGLFGSDSNTPAPAIARTYAANPMPALPTVIGALNTPTVKGLFNDAPLQQAITAEINRNQAAASGGSGGNYAPSFSNASYNSGGYDPGDGGGYISNSATGNDWDNF